jgi:aminopeptidase N
MVGLAMTPRIVRRLVAVCGVAGLLLAPAATPAQEGTPVAAGCTAGSSGIGDPYYPLLGNSGYDVQHYTLDIDLDVVGGAIGAGRATIEAVALVNLCAFNLDFLGLEITAVSVGGQPAAFSRRGGELTIAPASPLAHGEPFTVDIAYHGKPLGNAAPTVGSLYLELIAAIAGFGGELKVGPAEGEAEQYGAGWWSGNEEIFVAGEPAGAERWFPVNGHPADKATYTMRLTVPEPYAVVANGILTETITEAGGTTTVWEARDPMASYVVTLHAGRLDIDVREGPGGIPIRAVFAESVAPAQRLMFDRMPEMLEYFGSVFGPYPFASTGGTVVGSPIPFALETQTLPIYGALPLAPNQPLEAEVLESLDALVAHELAHQWFGNAVSLQSWQDTWLNEGFATYANVLWIEHTKGEVARNHEIARLYAFQAALDPYHDPAQLAQLNAGDVIAGYRQFSRRFLDRDLGERFLRNYRNGLGAATDAELETISGEHGLAQLAALGIAEELFPGVAPRTGDPGAANAFSPTVVYERGALTLHALRLTVGDAAFFAILREWTRRFHNGNATTEDFVALAEEISGESLDDLFEAWLFEPALPDLPAPRGAATETATPVAG